MKKYTEILLVLKVLNELGEASITAIQRKAKAGNWYAAKMALVYLKERGLVEEKYDPGPPGKFVYRLTSKGKEAAELAIKLLEYLE